MGGISWFEACVDAQYLYQAIYLRRYPCYAAQFGIATNKVRLRLEIYESSARGSSATASDSYALGDPIRYLGFEPPDRASAQWHRTRKCAGLDV